MQNIGKETEILEFKESTAEFDKACRAIVAMLNKSGFGTILFGVKDNGDVIGHLIGKDTLSNLANKIKDSIKPSIYPTIEPKKIGDKTVISISFSGKNKPYAYKGTFYIRVEQQNLPVDPLVIRELIKESHEYNEKRENEITNYGIESVDDNALDLFYRQAVAMKRINKFEHTNEELLTQLGLLVNGKLTNAGFYLFGKNCHLVYKAVEYPTIERLDPIDLKRYEGNIFNLINEIMNFINGKMKWRVIINDIQRKEIPEVPVIAIREIVINSLVHCDFYADSEHQVTFDPENIEIYNPGTFNEFTPLDYINKSLPSRTKHKMIQSIIYKAFDVETLGRGLKRMNEACKKENVTWSFTKYNFGFSFNFSRVKKQSTLILSTLSFDANILYKYMKDNNGILGSISIASSILDKKERAVRNTIKELLDSNLIKRVGSNKVGYWEIIE